MNAELPRDFQSLIQSMLGHEADEFFSSLESTSLSSVRFHPDKYRDSDLLELQGRVPWHPNAHYLERRPIFTLDPAFHAGAYYVQEASSMFLFNAIQSLDIDLSQPLRILDLCAAPGGKTTILSELGNQHLIVANEVIRSRYQILKENVTRWGFRNTILTNVDVERLEAFKHYFDIVLVDAPCSGEGLFRKDKEARTHWSLQSVAHCSARQKRILKAAMTLVKSGGHLVYSTCTYNDQENMHQVEWITENDTFTSCKIKEHDQFDVVEKQIKDVFGYQFYPHRLNGEGFFISILKRTKGDSFKWPKIKEKNRLSITKQMRAALSESFIIDERRKYYTLDNTIHCIDAVFADDLDLFHNTISADLGTPIAALKGKNLIPEHAVAVNPYILHTFPIVDIDKDLALTYLKREDMGLHLTDRSWIQLTYNGNGLGWVKNLGNRINNYLPKHLRIRMRIDMDKNQ